MGFLGLYALVLLGVSIVLTWIVLTWLRRRAIVDAPNSRSNHVIPTPRGGGLAVAVSVGLGWAALYVLRPDLATGLSPAMISGAVLLCAISWLDDLKGLGAGIRLPMHLLACVLGVWGLPGEGPVFQGMLPVWLEYPVLVLVWAGFLNFYNFMDGIDGITGVETLGIALGLTVLALSGTGTALPVGAPLTLAVAAAGFLVWNWAPAKLFMGDVGSIPLGFCLGWFLLTLASAGYWAAALILPGYYLADAGITLLRRAARMEKVWQAHSEHFYQRAVARRLAAGLDRTTAHRRISAVIACLNTVLIWLALLSTAQAALALVLSLVAVGGALWWMTR